MKSRFVDTAASLQQALKADKPFAFFDTNSSLEHLNVNAGATYNLFGTPETLAADLKEFIKALGNDGPASAAAAEKIDTLVKDILKGFDAEAGWITLRATMPTDEFNIPRWHQDGYFYEPFTGDQRKAAVSLKGSATLLNDLPLSRMEAFNAASRGNPNDDTEKRLAVAAVLDDAQTVQPRKGQGVVFIAGSTRGAVHSEPAMNEPRLFLSVLPGTKEQIEELRQRWNKPVTSAAAAKLKM